MSKSKEVPRRGDTAGKSGKSGGASRKRRIAVALAAVLVTASAAGGYVAMDTFAATPTEAEEAQGQPAGISGPMPVAVITPASPVRAGDYEIVSVFDGEAILSTADNLIRVKVGSLAPGLGTITSIDSGGDGDGGVVVGTEATLRIL